MKKQQILKGSKLIAEFMGYPTKSHWWHHPEPEIFIGLPMSLTQESCKFHSSMDWLMPVVDKIQSLGYNFRLNSYQEKNAVHCNFYKGLADILQNNKAYKTKHEAVFNTVVDFIKLHNKNKSHGSKVDNK